MFCLVLPCSNSNSYYFSILWAQYEHSFRFASSFLSQLHSSCDAYILLLIFAKHLGDHHFNLISLLVALLCCVFFSLFIFALPFRCLEQLLWSPKEKKSFVIIFNISLKKNPLPIIWQIFLVGCKESSKLEALFIESRKCNWYLQPNDRFRAI